MQLAAKQRSIPPRAAFRWRLAQPIAILVAAGLGVFSGWSFHGDNLAFAWMMFLFGFVWVLMLSVALGMWIAYRARVRRGDWRAGLHVGFASAFPLATVYLGLVALLTWSIPLTNVAVGAGHALSRPDHLRHFPVLYACSLLVGVLSGPLFAAWSPLGRE